MKKLRWFGYNTFPSFNEEFSINKFYDIITSDITSFDSEYILHIRSFDYNGFPLNEWVVFDTSSSNTFTLINKLYFQILNSVDKCNKLNSNLASSIIFEDGKSNFDEKIKHISITYYKYI